MALSEGEVKLLKKLDDLRLEGTNARDKASENWDRGIELVKGKFWPERRPKYKVNAVMNFLAQIIDRKAAILTDSRPTISVVSRKKIDDPLCEVLQKTIEGILDEVNFEQKLTEFVMLEEYFGFALFNTTFDKSLDHGKGDIDLVVIDPRTFIFDPWVSRSWNLKYAEYLCLETTKPTDLLREQYPERADDIKSDLSTGEVNAGSVVWKMLNTLFNWSKSGDTGKESVIKRSIVRDWWVIDRESKKDGKREFPTWRHILIAGGCPVADGGNPYIDGYHPFDAMEWNFDVDSPYGRNEVTNLESPQIMFNKVLATVLENSILMSNAIWVGDRNALGEKEWDKLTNEPGSHVRKKQGTELRREGPPALPTYIPTTLEMLMIGLEKLSGITEVTEGRKPGQVTSGVAIECTDFETECLTQRGWKHVYELEPDDKLYCMNEVTKMGVWSPLLQLNVQKNYTGTMFEFKNKQIDAFVTPNHDWVVHSTNTGNILRVTTNNLNTSHWIPGAICLDSNQVGGICSAYIVEFLGWLVTEGCITHKYSKDRRGNIRAYKYTEVKLSQSTTTNPENCKEIEKCLTDCGFNFNTKMEEDVKIWTLSTRDSEIIKQLFPDKRPGYKWISSSKPSLLKVLYNTMLKGDGTAFERDNTLTSTIYNTSDRELADQFQMLATLLGVSTAMSITPEKEGAKHKKECYRDHIKISCKQTSKIGVRNLIDNNEIKEVAFSGPIWCPTTLTGNWFARRGGKVYLTGNSLALMAQTTIRLKARQLEGLIQRVGQKLISRIFEYYTTDRVFNMVGSDAGVKQYFYQREKIRQVIEERGDYAFEDYIFKVVPSSSLAMTKWQKGLMATQLFQLGLIDEEAALDALEFPKREMILKRLAEKQQMMMKMGIQPRGRRTPSKMPANLLRGSTHKELGMQEKVV